MTGLGRRCEAVSERRSGTEDAMKRILKIVLGTIGGLIACCVVGSIVCGREDRRPSPPPPSTPPTAVAKVQAAPSPPVGDAPKVPSGNPWVDAVRLSDDEAQLSSTFWPLFDDLAGSRFDEEVAAKERAQPATWEAAVPEIRKAAAAKRSSDAVAIKAAVYRFELPTESFTYDPKKKAFTINVAGLTDLSVDWHLALSAPTVKRDVNRMRDAHGDIEGYTYKFVARATEWQLPFAIEQADAFARAHPSPRVQILFRVTSGVDDNNRPMWGGPSFNPKEELGQERGGAGYAVVAKVQTWRLVDANGAVLQGGQPAP